MISTIFLQIIFQPKYAALEILSLSISAEKQNKQQKKKTSDKIGLYAASYVLRSTESVNKIGFQVKK